MAFEALRLERGIEPSSQGLTQNKGRAPAVTCWKGTGLAWLSLKLARTCVCGGKRAS